MVCCTIWQIQSVATNTNTSLSEPIPVTNIINRETDRFETRPNWTGCWLHAPGNTIQQVQERYRGFSGNFNLVRNVETNRSHSNATTTKNNGGLRTQGAIVEITSFSHETNWRWTKRSNYSSLQDNNQCSSLHDNQCSILQDTNKGCTNLIETADKQYSGMTDDNKLEIRVWCRKNMMSVEDNCRSLSVPNHPSY